LWQRLQAADVDVELAMDGAARDLDLVLARDVGCLNGPAASGAGFGQGRFVGFVDVRGGLTMGLGAVVRAGLAAGPLRRGLRRPLGEGRGLALAGALRLLQLAVQAFDLGFELGDTVPQVGDQAVALAAARAGREVHTSIIGRAGRPQLWGAVGSCSAGQSGALIKYDQGGVTLRKGRHQDLRKAA
jgi:hypothetical protein